MSDEETKVLSEQKAGTTQPMLELILERINALDAKVTAGFEQIDQRMAAIENRLSEVEKSVRVLDRCLDVISIDLNKVHADLHDHEGRIDQIERKPS